MSGHNKSTFGESMAATVARRDRAMLGLRLVVAVLVACLVCGVGVLLESTQSSARAGVADRFAARAALAGKFVTTYVDQQTHREELVASQTLSGQPASTVFKYDSLAFAFDTSALFDQSGHVLAIAPSAPELIGQPIGLRYAHVRAALAGKSAVSDVVRSAEGNTPVVAFAVPFNTPQGRRVFSGAYAVADTPLGALLNDTTTLNGAHLYLVDSKNTVLAASGRTVKGVLSLAQRDPALSRAAATHARGSVNSTGTKYYFVKTAIAGTSWSLIIAAPSSALFQTVSGSSHWGPWLILAGLAALAIIAGWLWLRLFEGRRKLADTNRRLAELARTDVLSGLSNRRDITEQLETQLALATRHEYPVSVLMIDIDHFKQLNDRHGHHAGDLAIQQFTRLLRTSVRDGDLIARWGGDEFLAVLPYTNLAEACAVAERLRRAIAATTFNTGADTETITLSTSIGAAQAADDTIDALVHRADLGLYEAKAAGRNAVGTALLNLLV
jgi:diguanylate cyclase (GGDEF)-like protein